MSEKLHVRITNRDKTGHFTTTKWLINQEDTTVFSVYIPNDRHESKTGRTAK